MPPPIGAWSTLQLAEFVVALSAFQDVPAALVCGAERAAEAFEAEVAVVVRNDEVLAGIGFPPGRFPAGLVDAANQPALQDHIELPGLGPCRIATAELPDSELRLVVARVSDEAFNPAEVVLLRAMCRVLHQTTQLLATVERERERQRLLTRLSRIQRSISHGDPLQVVLDAITAGVEEVLGDETVGLRLVDPDDPSRCYLASWAGIPDDVVQAISSGPIGVGAGGRAITENRLVIIEDYQRAERVTPEFRDMGLSTAMAAPVHEHGKVVGSLVVSTKTPGRRYTEAEQEALLALAEHASLALADAKTVDAMREAQRSKDLFVAMVSHELKTPLTVILGTLRTLQQHGDGLPGDVRREILATSFARGRELQRLIDRLLRGARAELAGDRNDVPLGELVGGALDGFEQVRQLVVDVTPGAVVHVDAAAVQEIVGILVENAISHSPAETPIHITAAATETETTIAVSNTGALSDDLDEASLFRPFQRGRSATSSGVGLGLYIVARLAEAMAGRVEPESADGRVTFTLRVPRRVGEARFAVYQREPVEDQFSPHRVP